MKRIVVNCIIRFYNRLEAYNQRIVYTRYRAQYEIDRKVRFNGKNIRLYGNGRIVIAENTYLGEMCNLQSSDNNIIQIGRNCAISHNVKIYTCTYDADNNFDNLPRVEVFGDVRIGNGVWIGVNVFIAPGVTIGNNCVIGANSVITKDLMPNAIYGGVPAKLIRLK